MSAPERAARYVLREDPGVEPRSVVIVGGGIAAIEALMALDDLGAHHLRPHVVAAHSAFVLRPQLLGEPWGGRPLHIDLERLCRAFGASFTQATVVGVDPVEHHVRTAAGETIAYERLLIASGSEPELPYRSTRVLGFGALPVSLAHGTRGSVALVVPPGAGWTMPAYELALLVSAQADRDVRVVTPEAEPLEAFGPAVHTAVGTLLQKRHVTVETGRIHPIGDDLRGLADTVVALPLLRGPGLEGLPRGRGGFVHVDGRMAVTGVVDVHAAGDATDAGIKQGGLAAQQADTAAAEIVRSCGGSAPPVPYAPVLRGKLTAPDGVELFLRRALDGIDDGTASPDALWDPPGVVCAWRLGRWLDYRRDELAEYTVGHVARQRDAAALTVT